MAGVNLGIDYGTSNTVSVLRREDGRSRPLLFDSSPLLPSAVFATPTGELLTGRDAERSMRTDPASFEPNPKRRIDELEVLLGTRPYQVTTLVAATLRQVAAEAYRVAGRPPASVSMTHPAAWGPARRRVLQEAAALAGLPAPLLVPEPVAAAAYFTAVLGMRVAPGQSVVVYDLGAGTFDASVVQRTAAGFDTLAYRGLDDLGGLDLDVAVLELVCEALESTSGEVAERLRRPRSVEERRQRLLVWQDVRSARESLTRQASATVYVGPAGRDVIVTRAEFEAVAEPLLRRTVEVTLATARESRVAPDGLAGWYLVGGATRTPLVATLLLRATGRPATALEEPQLVVAEGALHCATPPSAPPVAPPAAPTSPPAFAPPPGPLAAPPVPSPAVPVSPPAFAPAPGPLAAPPGPAVTPPRPFTAAPGPVAAASPAPAAIPQPVATTPQPASAPPQPAPVRVGGRVPPLDRAPAELVGIALAATAAGASVAGGVAGDWLIAATYAGPFAVLMWYRIGRLTRPGRWILDAATTLLAAAVALYATIALTGSDKIDGAAPAAVGIVALTGWLAAVIWAVRTVRLLRR